MLLMTIVDILAIILFFLSLIYLYRFKDSAKNLHLMSGLSLILAGIMINTLFYIADLTTMHVFPFFMTMQDSMKLMKLLHANYIWIFNLLSIILILVGFIYILKILIPQLTHTLHELSNEKHNAKLETQNILLAVTEVSAVMNAIAAGHCNKRIDIELSGKMNQLKDDINNTAKVRVSKNAFF